MNTTNTTRIRAPGTHLIVGLAIAGNIVALSLVGFLWFLINEKTDRIAISLGELSSAGERERQLSALKNFVEETKEESGALEEHFLSGGDVAPLIDRIESLGARSGVLVEFTNVFVDEQKKVLNLNFETLGNFSDTYYFLSLVEKLPFKLSFDKVFLDQDIPRDAHVRSKDDTWRGVFSITVFGYAPDNQ